jgi:hypothetical protein
MAACSWLAGVAGLLLGALAAMLGCMKMPCIFFYFT